MPSETRIICKRRKGTGKIRPKLRNCSQIVKCVLLLGK